VVVLGIVEWDGEALLSSSSARALDNLSTAQNLRTSYYIFLFIMTKTDLLQMFKKEREPKICGVVIKNDQQWLRRDQEDAIFFVRQRTQQPPSDPTQQPMQQKITMTQHPFG
jgi:hypothetical protein